MKVRFGINVRRVMTGADLYVKIFQFSALMIVPYILIASGHMAIFKTNNPVSLMFDLGACLIPRTELLVLAYLYKYSMSEIMILFICLAMALIWGLLTSHFIQEYGDTGRRIRKVMILLIAADLILRLLPFSFNITFGWPMAILSFLVRLACMILVLMDLRSDNKKNN